VQLVSALLLAAGVTVVASPARAEEPEPFARSALATYQVTFAARACGSYADVAANTVRDDTESPGSPGKASPYRAGEPVDAQVEERAGCQPLPGAKFTLGGGREKKGPLSSVTSPGEPVTTVDSTPRLDAAGRPAGGPLIGAVTVTLTAEQLLQSVKRQLWVQGGTPQQPLPSGHSFGVLRCSTDGHTGGNTQWLGFAAGARHAYCYAYYVRGGGATGNVVVRTRTTRPVGYAQPFAFTSTLSQAGRFTVAGDGGEVTFTRTAKAYTLTPQLPSGWRLADVTCGGRKVTADKATGRTDITLSGEETATCVYTFEPPATPAGLSVLLQADAVGAAFDVRVEGSGGPYQLRGTVPGDGSAVRAAGDDLTALTTGSYTVTVAPPAADADLWSLAGATCNGVPAAPTGLGVSVTVGAATECVLRLTRRQGSIGLRLITEAGVAPGGFSVAPAGAAVAGWALTATTTGHGAPVQAKGDLPDGVAFGSYVITPLPPPATPAGDWKLTGFACETGRGSPIADGGPLRIELSAGTPDARCTATYQFTAVPRLQVVLIADPTARSSPAVLDVTCTDGSAGRVVLGPSEEGPGELPDALGVPAKASCTVTQGSTGAEPGGLRNASAVLEPAKGNAPMALPATVSLDEPGERYTLTITNTYARGLGDESRQAGMLGPFKLLPVALIGSGMIGIGVVILLVLVVRRRGEQY